jgi:3-deoxy-D-manno-octulosonic-acid transferase
MFLLYNLLLTITAPLWVPWMLWRASRRHERPDWKQRCGDFPIEPRGDRNRIWLHAVSVGEVVAALPVLRALRRLAPGHEIVLSVTTSSGWQTARDRAQGLFDHLVYFPIDVARFQLAAMVRVSPSVVAIMETELWFNFLWAAKAIGAHTMLINGRISDRSYPRARWFRFFYRRLLAYLDEALMQTNRDAERIRDLGARQVEVLGSTKFDEAADQARASQTDVRAWLGIPPDAPVVVIGSTRSEAEETLVLDALAHPSLAHVYVVHAPRHLERAAPLADAYRRRFGAVALRSKAEPGQRLILDTYGELGQAYAAADVVVVGGGFDNLGGQNLIQPLAHGKPVLHGPHMQNFAEVARMAQEVGASQVCRDADELARALAALLSDPIERERRSRVAQALVAEHLGAAERYAKAIARAAQVDAPLEAVP